ncbi:MAG TPA: CAP domain-containing protein [Candidatus Udaeobacter sp.]|nr:CAP domain-containing protein [Candidatus Udaeobacter sp.]
MRVVASVLAGFVLALGLAAGVSALAQRQANSHTTLTAARNQVAAGPTALVGFGNPAPQRITPRRSNDPGPNSPATAAPTAAPAPVSTAPAAAAPVAAAPARPPAIVVGSTQQALINRDRAAIGLGALTWNSCLYSVAVSNARRIAAQGYLSHTNGPNVDLTCGLGRQAGENIGYWTGGINDSQLNTMFMNSPEHRANILGPYHYVATAWVVAANGYGYVAVEFS